MNYQWDADKARRNLQKHGVNFSDAATIFEDEMAFTIEDPDAMGERRFVTVGRDATGEILTVVYTLRGENIRIISARPATRHERRDYEEES